MSLPGWGVRERRRGGSHYTHPAAPAPQLPGVLYEPRGRQMLRNIRELIELFAAVPQAPS